jgi:hypothetical protein
MADRRQHVSSKRPGRETGRTEPGRNVLSTTSVSRACAKGRASTRGCPPRYTWPAHRTPAPVVEQGADPPPQDGVSTRVETGANTPPQDGVSPLFETGTYTPPQEAVPDTLPLGMRFSPLGTECAFRGDCPRSRGHVLPPHMEWDR